MKFIAALFLCLCSMFAHAGHDKSMQTSFGSIRMTTYISSSHAGQS
jgi:hypothetical protein